MKILWCVSGAGHYLEEIVKEFEIISREHEVSAVTSLAGEEVLKAYGLFERVLGFCCEVFFEKNLGYSTPLSGSGKFKVAVVAPATANTCAKAALGISDSALTNIIAQFTKRRINVIILPSDQGKEVETKIPSGRKIKVYCRKIDLKNVEKLRKSDYITVISNPRQIRKSL